MKPEAGIGTAAVAAVVVAAVAAAGDIEHRHTAEVAAWPLVP